MAEKITLSRSTESEELTEEEYAEAKNAVKALRARKAAETEAHRMSPEDAAKAKGAGKVHGDPFVVIE
jgi:hypothetical protein